MNLSNEAIGFKTGMPERYSNVSDSVKAYVLACLSRCPATTPLAQVACMRACTLGAKKKEEEQAAAAAEAAAIQTTVDEAIARAENENVVAKAGISTGTVLAILGSALVLLIGGALIMRGKGATSA